MRSIDKISESEIVSAAGLCWWLREKRAGLWRHIAAGVITPLPDGRLQFPLKASTDAYLSHWSAVANKALARRAEEEGRLSHVRLGQRAWMPFAARE